MSLRGGRVFASGVKPPPNEPQRVLRSAEYKDRVKAMWDKRASVYDQSDTFHRRLAETLVQFSGIKAGQSVLDIACGTGMVSFPAAECVGFSGEVIGVDISENMLKEAEKKAEAKGFKKKHLQFFPGDAEHLQIFPEERFDFITCSSGMLYLQNMDTALEKFRAWLKKGGKLCFNSPQEPCVPATKVFYSLLRENLGINLSDAAEPLSDTEKVQQQCKGAGFSKIEVETSEEILLFPNMGAEGYAERIWKSLATNAIFTPIEGIVTEEDLEKKIKPDYMKKVLSLAEPWEGKKGVANPYTMLWVKATK